MAADPLRMRKSLTERFSQLLASFQHMKYIPIHIYAIAKLERRITRAQESGDSKLLAESQAALETQRAWLAQATGRP